MPRPKKDYAADERVQRMATMHAQGMTLAKIGEVFGMTRERVRQLITKIGAHRTRLKMVSELKGAAEARRQAAREAECLAKWGVDLATCAALRKDGTIRAYRHQRESAASRAIPFLLTFSEWYAIWCASGKLSQRGRGAGHYCMSRIRDDGPYELGNVHIQLCTQNSREAVEVWRGKTKEFRGVYNLYPGRTKPWLAKVGKARLGYYASAEEAAAARDAFISQQQAV